MSLYAEPFNPLKYSRFNLEAVSFNNNLTFKQLLSEKLNKGADLVIAVITQHKKETNTWNYAHVEATQGLDFLKSKTVEEIKSLEYESIYYYAIFGESEKDFVPLDGEPVSDLFSNQNADTASTQNTQNFVMKFFRQHLLNAPNDIKGDSQLYIGNALILGHVRDNHRNLYFKKGIDYLNHASSGVALEYLIKSADLGYSDAIDFFYYQTKNLDKDFINLAQIGSEHQLTSEQLFRLAIYCERQNGSAWKKLSEKYLKLCGFPVKEKEKNAELSSLLKKSDVTIIEEEIDTLFKRNAILLYNNQFFKKVQEFNFLKIVKNILTDEIKEVFNEVITLAEFASKLGSAKASYLLGIIHQELQIHEKSDFLSFYYFRQAAPSLPVAAQQLVNICEDFIFGRGNKPSIKLGISYIKKSAKKYNNLRAHYVLAHLYASGASQFVEKNEKLALEHLTISAQGYDEAIFSLGKIHEFGKLGVEKDIKKATDYYLQLSPKHHLGANTRLFYLVTLPKARQGKTRSEFFAGMAYELGSYDLQANHDQAIYWYERAAADKPNQTKTELAFKRKALRKLQILRNLQNNTSMEWELFPNT